MYLSLLHTNLLNKIKSEILESVVVRAGLDWSVIQSYNKRTARLTVQTNK